MGYKVEVNYPNLPKGEVVTIDGVGELVNGSTTEVSDAQADAFRTRHPISDKDGNLVQGPTLLKAFESSEHVKVTSTKKTEGSNS